MMQQLFVVPEEELPEEKKMHYYSTHSHFRIQKHNKHFFKRSTCVLPTNNKQLH
jgi:hypothetical protein